MSLHAFNMGCNIVGIKKNDRLYGMCCAWAQMIDYDRITLLIGSQSATGKILKEGDIVGISSLSAGQDQIALQLGDKHSDKDDKWNGIVYETKDSAILIPKARVKMKCLVRAIHHLEGIEEDAFIDLKVLEYEQDEQLPFLSAYEVL